MDMKDNLAEALRKIAHMDVKFDHRGDHSRRVVEIAQAALAEYDAQPAQAAQPVSVPDGLIDTIMRYPHNGTTLGNIICAEIPGDVLRAAMREALAGAPQPPAQPSADAESNG